MNRRTALTGMVGVGSAALVGCGSEERPDAASTPTPTPSASESPTASPTATPTPSESAAPNGLGAAAEVPVGGGTIFSDQRVVVTQPEKGEFKAFSAVCTHQGCVVSSVSDGTINCGCHGSRYDITDGSVVGGPAPAALGERTVTVKGGRLTVE